MRMKNVVKGRKESDSSMRREFWRIWREWEIAGGLCKVGIIRDCNGYTGPT